MKQVSAYKSDGGSVFNTAEEAVADDIISLLESASGGQAELSTSTTMYMIKHRRPLIQYLEQLDKPVAKS